MKSKTVTIATATLNDGNVHSIDPTLTIDKAALPQFGGGSPRNDIYMPRAWKIYNGTGSDIEYVITSSAEEDAEFAAELAAPGAFPYYAFTKIKAGDLLYEKDLNLSYKIYFRKVTGGTVTADLRIDFQRYGFANMK